MVSNKSFGSTANLHSKFSMRHKKIFGPKLLKKFRAVKEILSLRRSCSHLLLSLLRRNPY